jgi:hypothetical protein
VPVTEYIGLSSFEHRGLSIYGSLKLSVSFHQPLEFSKAQKQKKAFHNLLLSTAYTKQYKGTNLKSIFKIQLFDINFDHPLWNRL